MTRNVLKRCGISYVEVPNEAAFYGPKIDVQVWSVIGREFTIATNQVDFAQPRRFDLRYKDRDNTEKVPLCIHRAPLGSHERFIGFLIDTPVISHSGFPPSRSASCPSATKLLCSITRARSSTNSAPTRSAPRSTNQPTRLTAKSSAPNK